MSTIGIPYGDEYIDPQTGEKAVEEGVEWVDFTEDDLRGLALRAQEARNGMRKEKFAPSPSPDNCRWCDYLSICEARQDQIKANSKNRPKKTLDALSNSSGFVDLD